MLTNVLERGLLFSSKTGGVQVFSDKITYWLAGNGPLGVGGLELVYLSSVGLQFAKPLQPIGSYDWYLKKFSKPG